MEKNYIKVRCTEIVNQSGLVGYVATYSVVRELDFKKVKNMLGNAEQVHFYGVNKDNHNQRNLHVYDGGISQQTMLGLACALNQDLKKQQSKEHIVIEMSSKSHRGSSLKSFTLASYLSALKKEESGKEVEAELKQ